MAIQFTLNNKPVEVSVEADTPLLWVLRDTLSLTGTKFGCGKMQCGACTVHVDGEAAKTCMLPISAVAGKSITTIEGLGEKGLNVVQEAWLEEQVPQCGYCQSGQIMAATALLKAHPQPTDEQIDEAMRGVLCRCGTYPRLRRAIKRAGQGGEQ